MSDNENSAYEKLTPARKALVDAVMKNLENGVGLWEQGWAGGGAPVSGISGKQYNGINRMFLMAATNKWKIRVGALSATKREEAAARTREYRLNTLNFVTGKQSSPLTDTLLTEWRRTSGMSIWTKTYIPFASITAYLTATLSRVFRNEKG